MKHKSLGLVAVMIMMAIVLVSCAPAANNTNETTVAETTTEEAEETTSDAPDETTTEATTEASEETTAAESDETTTEEAEATAEEADETTTEPEDDSEDEAVAGEDDNKVYKIAILQLTEHDALDKAAAGIISALDDEGWVEGEDYELELSNAQGDQANLKAIADRFVADESDIIFAIATPAAQTLAISTETIPILGTAITDYESAKLVDSNEEPGRNVSGTSDMNPVAEQVELAVELLPEMKTLGIIYNSSEVNSEIQAGIAEEAAKELGLEVEIATISNLNDLQQVAGSLMRKVDLVYVPTDNLIASAMPLMARVATDEGVPVIGGEAGMVSKGALATIGIDYFELGRLTGEMGVKVLRGEAEPATLPIGFQTEFELTVNQDLVEALNIELPERWNDEAEFVSTVEDEASDEEAGDSEDTEETDEAEDSDDTTAADDTADTEEADADDETSDVEEAA